MESSDDYAGWDVKGAEGEAELEQCEVGEYLLEEQAVDYEYEVGEAEDESQVGSVAHPELEPPFLDPAQEASPAVTDLHVTKLLQLYRNLRRSG